MSKFDIDRFPTSEAARRMLKKVSPVYQNSYFMKWLCQVMGMEWDEARKYVLSLREQAFTESVTWGIEYQEHKYSIVPDESLSLEERRARLGRKTAKRFPLNPGNLERYIEKGWGIPVDVDETYASGVLKLTTDELLPRDFDSMLADVYAIKPSHLSLYAKLRLHGELDLVSGFALPIAQDRLVDISPPKDGIEQPMSIGFLTKDTFQETGAAVPLKAAFDFAVSLRQGPLFSHHVKAQDENIDIPDRLGGEDLSMVFGAVLWRPSSAIRERIPKETGARLFSWFHVSPATEKAIRAALPEQEGQSSLFVGILYAPLLPRHVNAGGQWEPPEWNPVDRRGSLRVGFLMQTAKADILPATGMPETAQERASVGFISSSHFLLRGIRARPEPFDPWTKDGILRLPVGMIEQEPEVCEVFPAILNKGEAKQTIGIFAGEIFWNVHRKE